MTPTPTSCGPTYFRNVIEWVKLTFPNYRKEMKGIDWGALYDEFHGRLLDIARLEQQVKALMADDDVTKKKGIYAYVLTGDERHLNIRVFSDNQKREAYERQNGVCHSCRQRFELSQMEADHITPWSKGGKTSAANCRITVCGSPDIDTLASRGMEVSPRESGWYPKPRKPTTSPPGAKAAKPAPPTARCCASTATGAKARCRG